MWSGLSCGLGRLGWWLALRWGLGLGWRRRVKVSRWCLSLMGSCCLMKTVGKQWHRMPGGM